MADNTIYPFGTGGTLPSSIGIVNDMTTGGSGSALSAEQGKKLNSLTATNLDAVNNKVNELINSLANIAFTDEKPTENELSWPRQTITLSGDTTTVTTDAPEDGALSGAKLALRVTPKTFYGFTSAPSVTVGGTTLDTAVTGNSIVSNSDGSYTVNIAAVTGTVAVTVSTKNYNVVYDKIRYQHSSGYGDTTYLFWGKNEGYRMSPMCDLGADRSESISVTFKCASSVTNEKKTAAMYTFNADGEFLSFWVFNAAPRTVSIGASTRYVRIVYHKNDQSYAFIKTGYGTESEQTLFDGSSVTNNDIGDIKQFFEYPFITFSKDDDGNIHDMGFITENQYYTTIGTAFNKEGASKTWVKRLKGDRIPPFYLSPMIELPLHGATGSETRPFTFSAGGVFDDVAPFVLAYYNGDCEYLSTSQVELDSDPKSVNLKATYVKCRLIFNPALDCYVKDDTDNTILWQWDAPETEE